MAVDWKLEQYRNSRGGKPVEEFIESLRMEEQALVVASLTYLQQVGNRAREPLSKDLGYGLLELRVRAQRIFFCFRPGRIITLLHGFTKKTQKTPQRELQTARQRLKEVRVGNKYSVPFTFDLQKKMKQSRFAQVFQTELNRLMLAHRIAELREKRGLSQAELAKLVGTTQSSIARLENSNYQNYSIKTLERIAEALGVRLVVDLQEAPLGKKAA